MGVLDADYYNRENRPLYADYKAGTLDIQAFLISSWSLLAGRDRAELDAWHENTWRATSARSSLRVGAS